MRRIGSRLILVTLATALAALALVATSSGSNERMTTSAAGSRVTVRDSTHKFKYKPTSLYFAYRALFPPFKITKLRYWVSWNDVPTEAAAAEGWLHYDNCKPNCADGHYRRKRAMVQLYGVHRCHGRRVFGKVSVKPRHLPAHQHKINCRGILK